MNLGISVQKRRSNAGRVIDRILLSSGSREYDEIHGAHMLGARSEGHGADNDDVRTAAKAAINTLGMRSTTRDARILTVVQRQQLACKQFSSRDQEQNDCHQSK